MKVSDEELTKIINSQTDPMQSSEMALLISRYSPAIRIKAAKLKNKNIEPEDLCQEGYLALFEAVRAFDPEKGSFSACAGTCINNSMKNAVILVPDESGSADEYLITKEDNDEIAEKLLTLLTEKEYDVLRLYLDGYSYKQIAEKMGISQKSVDNGLSRARKKLKELL